MALAQSVQDEAPGSLVDIASREAQLRSSGETASPETPMPEGWESPAFLASDAELDLEEGGVSHSVRRVVHTMSTWRVPSETGKLPRYVQQSFRAKTFGLLTIQFALVLVEMSAVEMFVTPGSTLVDKGLQVYKHLFFIAVGLTMSSLAVLYWFRHRFPLNYALLGVVTLLVGVFWGLADVANGWKVHKHLIVILGVTMLVATVASWFLSMRRSTGPWTCVVVSLALGWFVGSTVLAGVLARLGVELSRLFLASGLALALVMALLLDVGGLLVRGNPDDFLQVVVAMNSTLLVMVTLPVLLLVACCMKASFVAQQEDPPWAEAPAAEGIAAPGGGADAVGVVAGAAPPALEAAQQPNAAIAILAAAAAQVFAMG